MVSRGSFKIPTAWRHLSSLRGPTRIIGSKAIRPRGRRDLTMLSTSEIIGTVIGSSFAAYVLSVLLLYRYPCLLHKRKPYLFDGYLIAHRGGAGENLENTLAAFRHAVHSARADILELDLHLTKDKQVVICHDSDMSRSTGQPVIVEETDYADLPPLVQHPEITFDMGTHLERVCEDTQIPLFEDLLKALPDTALNIDLKNGSQELVQLSAELIQRYGRTKTVLWGSSVGPVHNMARLQDPSIPRYFDLKGILKVMFLFWSGLLAYWPLEEQVMELPYIPPEMLDQISQSRNVGAGWRFLMFLSNRLLLNKYLIAYLQRRGFQTYAFVLNEEEYWRRMFDRGVTGIHTDYPTRMRRFLDENPQYTQRKAGAEAGERDALMAAPKLPRDDL